MWIERLFHQVQGRGPVGSRANHQQGLAPGDLQRAIWENPARTTPRGSVRILLNFVNKLLRLNNSERIEAGPAPSVNEPLTPAAMWTGCGRGCGFVIHGPRETSDSKIQRFYLLREGL